MNCLAANSAVHDSTPIRIPYISDLRDVIGPPKALLPV